MRNLNDSSEIKVNSLVDEMQIHVCSMNTKYDS